MPINSEKVMPNNSESDSDSSCGDDVNSFAERMTSAIHGSELLIFDECAHAPIYEKVEEFNQKTLAFLQRHTV